MSLIMSQQDYIIFSVTNVANMQGIATKQNISGILVTEELCVVFQRIKHLFHKSLHSNVTHNAAERMKERGLIYSG